MIKLNLGSGLLPLVGYVNVDIHEVEGTDVVHDIRKIKELYADNSIDEIFSKDVLEHIGRTEWKDTLQSWVDILKPGGVLKIRVPDTLKLFKQYQIKEEREHKRSNFDNLLRLLFGLQDFTANIHLTGYCREYLVSDIEEMGMRVLNTHYNGGVDLRVTAVKGEAQPLVDLIHPDYALKKIK